MNRPCSASAARRCVARPDNNDGRHLTDVNRTLPMLDRSVTSRSRRDHPWATACPEGAGGSTLFPVFSAHSGDPSVITRELLLMHLAGDSSYDRVLHLPSVLLVAGDARAFARMVCCPGSRPRWAVAPARCLTPSLVPTRIPITVRFESRPGADGRPMRASIWDTGTGLAPRPGCWAECPAWPLILLERPVRSQLISLNAEQPCRNS